ncbi:serine dehydratase [Burkholderia sp. MSMB617WGS]|uniref:Serine dehydratase n=1 Tax=Burkholderia savannae TaxID=1637837 RepID=A0ABR5TBK2_9BURK|nr:serine dehydratase [Burkholderia savannae]AOK46296.1 serine dehydratase [Burkholderia sp. MSMB617WGS]KVG46423.1 serine dehydratase [Burkholderia sp. MSMB0265]KVG79082.1 serine dehydratase [Burkholderia sp. MSMB2040]KVG90356.1 serine dehydratase [Burkholderia sp. MSMB2041]KVG95891.1 serine dehydratase [Burkholderia sp. MSMB2042]
MLQIAIAQSLAARRCAKSDAAARVRSGGNSADGEKSPNAPLGGPRRPSGER